MNGFIARVRLVRVAGLVVFGYFVWVVGLVTLQRSILFPRDAIPAAPDPSNRLAGLVRLDVAHEAGRSEGWLLLGRGVSAERPGPAVVFGHGNAELIDFNVPFLEPYRDLGVSVALLEYRGYGRSDGEPSEAAITADLLAFHDLLVARPEVDAGRLVYHGRSLGGGAVCALAARRPPRALVLESTFRSVRVMARRFMVPGFLVADPFDNEAVLRTLDAPVLVFHGQQDELIPFEHGTALASIARNATLVPFSCGHNDLPPDERAYWGAIRAHLERAGVL